jgi:hypothetical protein
MFARQISFPDSSTYSTIITGTRRTSLKRFRIEKPKIVSCSHALFPTPASHFRGHDLNEFGRLHWRKSRLQSSDRGPGLRGTGTEMNSD